MECESPGAISAQHSGIFTSSGTGELTEIQTTCDDIFYRETVRQTQNYLYSSITSDILINGFEFYLIETEKFMMNQLTFNFKSRFFKEV